MIKPPKIANETEFHGTGICAPPHWALILRWPDLETQMVKILIFLSKFILFYGYKQSLYALESFRDLSLAFDRFSIENLRDLSKNALTSSVFELEKCSFF